MKKKFIVLILLIGFLLFIIEGFNDSPQVTEYEFKTDLLNENIRILFISDFHSSEFGNELFEEIENSQADVVLLGGDIFDEERTNNNTINLLSFLSSKFLCYFVTGNHEYWCGENGFKQNMNVLQKYGITRLSGENVQLNIKGQTINLCGVDDPANQLFEIADSPEKEFECQLEKISDEADNGYFTLLLTHRPEYISKYTNKGFNLVLAGHAHGGQVRIPFIMKGIYAPGQGLFPEYTEGIYSVEDTTMIVSRGLSIGKEIIPRFYNQPELVVVNLVPD